MSLLPLNQSKKINMKILTKNNINTREYWNTHQTALDFGLRQKKYLELAGKGEKIVELGCGLSPMLTFADNFATKIGVDFSQETIKEANEAYKNVLYVLSDVVYTPFPNESFDAVVSGEVIEHIEDPKMLIEEMDRICKKEGIMIISTPHLEFTDPEHLWEFDEQDFNEIGWETETVQSDRFKGRSYIFAWKRK